jgi:hypothetical protein
MTVIIILLALFGIKHFIADFVLQFDFMLKDKGTYGAEGGKDHAAMHAIGTWIILIFFTNMYSAMLLAMLDGFIHYHIDWAKTNLSRGLTSADRKFWIWLGADQGLHYLTYILIIGIIVL